jgi:ribonucleoside-diphosphate reductase alpha chain
MNVSQKILSDITVFNKYAKFVPSKQRRENWNELCDRNQQMHVTKYPQLEVEIKAVYDQFVRAKKVLPSMRSMQFGGRPIELSNNRMFNCAYVAVDSPAAFWESMFLLLGGSGVGFSVQKHHVENLPEVKGPTSKNRRFLIGDSIEGWADAVKVLVRAYFEGKSDPMFDFRDIRQKGAKLVTSGGKAPGPDPLRICLDHVRAIMNDAVGRRLTTLECHDLMCRIADAVLTGGIRRAALISLFSEDDLDMLSCKSGMWWELNPQRGRSNNSVVIKRGTIAEADFNSIWEQVKASGAGEPGVFWTNDYDIGTNPCCEISLKSMQFCNLTEINVSDVESQEDLNARAKAAALLGTLQAGYTDFHYLRAQWKDNTDKDALIGVGMTGIGSGKILSLDIAQAAAIVNDENARIAAVIGINPASRTTCVKPSGTSSLTVGSSSGVHAWHNDYYIRRMRVGKNEALYEYMIQNFPQLIEDCKFKPHIEAVMSFPQAAPEGSILRTEPAINLLERVKLLNTDWVATGYREGPNQHNVSCTISVKPEEWESVGKWMWDNQNYYTGIAVLPYDNGTYVQAPFEDCTKEVYEEMMKSLHEINLNDVIESDDNTNLSEQAACAGGACEVTF